LPGGPARGRCWKQSCISPCTASTPAATFLRERGGVRFNEKRTSKYTPGTRSDAAPTRGCGRAGGQVRTLRRGPSSRVPAAPRGALGCRTPTAPSRDELPPRLCSLLRPSGSLLGFVFLFCCGAGALRSRRVLYSRPPAGSSAASTLAPAASIWPWQVRATL